MKIFYFIFFVLALAKSEIVEIDDGKIEGTKLLSRLDKSFLAFFKIPYAKPPIGDLRFRDPIPNVPWSGILNGTQQGPVCFQKYPRDGASEDCLHLNIFTRKLQQKKPVVIYIHGGGYEIGSGLDQGPHNLIDRDVVIVTINYRLGSFGFLAMGTEEAPGNAGMKDQVLALKWVKKNIQHFGGDENKVTIAGYSAGGFSVTAHMASSMSKGLFHRAIAMSGAITTSMPLDSNNLEVAKKIGKILNCKVKNLLDCLKKTKPEDIAFQDIKSYPECEVVIWMPVIEKDFGQERFFVADPSDIFRSGNFNKVPVMIGRTTDEFISSVPALLESPRMSVFNENFNEMAPYCFFYHTSDQKKSDGLSKAIRKSFLPNKKIDVRSFNGLNYLFGDGIIGYPVHKFVRLVSNFTDVYYYKFSFISRNGYSYPHQYPYGVNHGDDLQYSFNNGPLIKIGDPEAFMVERMTKIIQQFSLTGNPNLKHFNWPKYESSEEFYMDIGKYMVEKNGLFIERYSVWDDALKRKKNSDKFSRKKLLIAKLGIYEIDELI